MLIYETVPKTVIIATINHDDRLFLAVEIDGELIAKFNIESIWDMLKVDLSKSIPINNIDLDRRKYEAMNIYRLTNEYLNQENVK